MKLLCTLLLLVAFELTAELHVCTVANRKTKNLEQLLESCAQNQVPIDVLGLGLPYPGNGVKLTYFKNYVANLPDDDLVLFVDAFDVLILASPQKLVDTFLSLGVRCLLGAEVCGAVPGEICPFPNPSLRDRFPPSRTKFRFLCSGTIMADAGYLKMLLEKLMPINEKSSDQGQLTTYFLAHPDEIALDYQCTMFLTLHGVPFEDVAFDSSQKQVFCKPTGTFPCIIHGNSQDGKVFYQRIYKALFGAK